MNKREKLFIAIPIIVIVGLISFLIYFNVFNKTDDTGYADYENENKTEARDSKEDIVKEKTLEEKEREIESKKPTDKIIVDLLKDTSNADVDDTLETLPDAPLHYAIDSVDIKLKENPETIEKPTGELAKDDIKRIQGYGYDWYTGCVDKVPPNVKYGEYYEKHPEYAEIIFEEYVPQRLDVFKNAIVGWITDPNLVYETAKGYYGVSGIFQLSYLREGNMFDLKPYKGYERDVEFRFANTTDGLFLRQIIYLSDWREIETWQNPYE